MGRESLAERLLDEDCEFVFRDSAFSTRCVGAQPDPQRATKTWETKFPTKPSPAPSEKNSQVCHHVGKPINKPADAWRKGIVNAIRDRSLANFGATSQQRPLSLNSDLQWGNPWRAQLLPWCPGGPLRPPSPASSAFSFPRKASGWDVAVDVDTSVRCIC